jgi:predicted Zn-dependent peptidase
MLQKTLDNGLRVVAQSMPHFHSISLGVWIAAGSVKEQQNEAGISHMIEHMLFKGTERYSAQQIAAEMDAIGAQINAFTAKECTCFYIKATSDHLEQSMEMLSQLVLHSVLDPQELEKEKGVVIEEINMVEDTPEDLAQELISAAFYGDHPLGKPILGTAESVGSFSRQDLQRYMDKHYIAPNILIAIAGNFEEQQLMDCAEKYFDMKPGGEALPFPKEPQRPRKKVLTREKRDVGQAHICLALPGYCNEDPRYFPLMVLSNALGGNMSSRLFQKIREERGLAYTVYSYTSAYRNTGALGIYAGANASQAATAVELMLQELELLKEKGLSKEEFQRSKNQLRGAYILGCESTGSRMSAIGKSLLLNGKIHSEDEIIAKIDAITPQSVEEILEDVLNFEHLCGSFVGKFDKKAVELLK